MCEKHTRSYILWIYHYLILLTLCEFGVEYKFCVNPAEQSIRAKYISWSENGLTLPTLSCGSFSRIYKKKKKQDAIGHLVRCPPASETNYKIKLKITCPTGS